MSPNDRQELHELAERLRIGKEITDADFSKLLKLLKSQISDADADLAAREAKYYGEEEEKKAAASSS